MLVFKETEMRNFRIQTQLDCDEKFAKLQSELQDKYLKKNKQLSERETKLIALFEQRIHDFDKEQQKFRIKQLSDLDQEEKNRRDMQREKLAILSDAQTQEEKMKAKEEELMRKMNEVDCFKDEVDYEKKLLDKKRDVKIIPLG